MVNPASDVPTTFFELAEIAASGQLGLLSQNAMAILFHFLRRSNDSAQTFRGCLRDKVSVQTNSISFHTISTC